MMPEGAQPNGPRSPKGARTRARLVDAAKQVFEEQGFLDARISDIADRAGMSHGSFYHYFDSKEAVFAEVVQAMEDRMRRGSLVSTGLLMADDDHRMEDFVRRSCRTYLTRYRADARIMGAIEQVSRYDEDFRQAHERREARYLEEAVAGIEHLQAAGRIDPDLEPRIAGPAVFGMMTRFAEMWLVQRTVECTLEEAADNLAVLVGNALGVRVGPPRKDS